MNLYTKFEVSILNGCGAIFDKKSGKKEKGREEQIGECLFAISQYNLSLRTSIPKSGKKEKGTNKRKNKKEKAHFQSHDTTCGCEPVYQI